MSTLLTPDELVLPPNAPVFHMFFTGSLRFQGLKCSTSPTSGTTDSLVRGDFALKCVQRSILVILTAGARSVDPPAFIVTPGLAVILLTGT